MYSLWKLKVLVARVLNKSKAKQLAQTAYISALKSAPGSEQAAIHYRLAHVYLAASENSSGIEHLQKAVELSPNVPFWAYKLGHAHLLSGDVNAARETFEAMLVADPELPLANYGMARTLAKSNDVAGAMNVLRVALAGVPNSKKYHTLMLKLARRTAQQPLIRATLEEAVVNSGENQAWTCELADIYDSMAEHEKALELLSFVKADTEESSALLFRAGRVLERLGRSDEAELYLFSAVNRLNADARDLGPGTLYQSVGQLADAKRWYEQILAAKGPVAKIHYQLGRCFEADYEWESAEEWFALASSSEAPEAHWYGHLGIVREQLQKLDAACSAYRSASGIDTSENNSWTYRLVKILALLVREDKIQEIILKDCAEVPKRLRARIARRPKSGADSSAAFQIFSRHIALGLDYGEQGDFSSAVVELELATARNNSHWADLYLSLAFAQAKNGQAAEAAVSYARSRMVQSVFVHDSRGMLSKRESQQRIYFAEFQNDYSIDDNAILYESGAGATMACNPLAMFRQLIERKEYAGFRHFWAVNKGEAVPQHLLDDPRVFVIRRNSDLYLKVLASAKYLINNNTFPPFFSRREGQKYLNTWHGVPLKTLGVDIQNGQMDHKNAARNLLHATHVLVPNDHTAHVLLERYDIEGLFDGKTAKIGYPRIDSVISPKDSASAAIRERLGIDGKRPVVLYAPTWRGDLKGVVLDEAKIKADLAKLESTGCKILFRGHTMAEKAIAKTQLQDALVPSDIETNDLLSVIDVLVTDYSSIFFDFIPTGKPIFFYAYDLEEYKAERGLYFDLDEMPGEVCLDIDQLAQSIKNIESYDWSSRADYIRANEMFCAQEDGNASSRAIEFLFEDKHVEVTAAIENPRINALFYQGSFIPNGITSSFRNLIANIDLDKVRPVVVLQPSSVLSRPEREEELANLSGKIQCIALVGGQAGTLEERRAIADFNRDFEWRSDRKRDVYMEGYRREFRRVFGTASFDTAVSFEGFQRHFAALIAASPEPELGRSIMLHSAMTHERDTRFKHLNAVFNLYDQFQHLISVSSSVSDLNIEELTAEFNIPADKFEFAENLLDLQTIRKRGQEPVDAELLEWMQSGDYTFINVARLSPEKDHLKLVRALATAREQSKLDLRLMLVGDGPMRSEIEVLTHSLQLDDAVLFAGRQSNPYPLLKAADCFAFSSNYEGQGIAVLESLVLDTPVVSTDVVGPRSILEGGFGMLVENSVEGLATGLIDQATNRPSYKPFDSEGYNQEGLRKFNQIVFGI